MRPKQFESLLVKAVIFSLPLIMFIAVPWMEVLSCWGDWIYLKGSLCKRHNELIFKVRCYATTSLSQKLLDFFAQLTNTNKHSNTGKQRHFCAVKKNIVLSLNFVTKNSGTSRLLLLLCSFLHAVYGFCNYPSTYGLVLLRSEIPSGICAKLRTVAASNNRVHMPWSLYYCLFAPHISMVLFFTHIPFVVNHTINATPPERLQQCYEIWLMYSAKISSRINTYSKSYNKQLLWMASTVEGNSAISPFYSIQPWNLKQW